MLNPPISTIAVAALAVGVSLMYAIGTRLLTDVERTKRIQVEVSAFQKELREVLMRKDKNKEAKLRKKEPAIKKLQAQLFKENLKPTLLFMVPLLLVWYAVLPMWVAPLGSFVADSPVPLNFPLLSLTAPSTVGTASLSSPLHHVTYFVYATDITGGSSAEIEIRDADGNRVASERVEKGQIVEFKTLGLTVKLITLREAQDGTPAQADLEITGIYSNGVHLWSWYLIGSFAFATVVRKVLGLA